MCVNEQRAMAQEPRSELAPPSMFSGGRTDAFDRGEFGTEHTTVARYIQALEDELNSRLFHKSTAATN